MSFISVTEAAELLGISRVAVLKKIQKGEIKAEKVGHHYIIAKNEIQTIDQEDLSDEQKKFIEKSVKKTIQEYGEALRMLKDA